MGEQVSASIFSLMDYLIIDKDEFDEGVLFPLTVAHRIGAVIDLIAVIQYSRPSRPVFNWIVNDSILNWLNRLFIEGDAYFHEPGACQLINLIMAVGEFNSSILRKVYFMSRQSF